MKKSLRLAGVAFAIFTLAFASCNKKEPTTPTPPVAATGTVNFTISNEVDNAAVAMNGQRYNNGAGNNYSIHLLKYYLCDFTLVRVDGTEDVRHNVQLIDASLPESAKFSLDSVLNGNYTELRFTLGVDSMRNHTGVQEGALDPVNGMIWSWNTGYIFFKHEGDYIDSMGATKSVLYHYGTDAARTEVSVSLLNLPVKGNSPTVNLIFNLNKLYSFHENLDFNVDNNRMSTDKDDQIWLNKIRENFPHAFTLKDIKE